MPPEIDDAEMPLGDVIQFPTGAVRSTDADQVRFDLITPIGLRRLAETCAEGARKSSTTGNAASRPV